MAPKCRRVRCGTLFVLPTPFEPFIVKGKRYHICCTISAEDAGATPDKHDSTGKGTSIEPFKGLPNLGSEEALAFSHSHSPFKFCHVELSPVSRNRDSDACAVPRTICGRGYSGSGVFSADICFDHRVGISAAWVAGCATTLEFRHDFFSPPPLACDLSQQTGPDPPEQFSGANTYATQPLVALHFDSQALWSAPIFSTQPALPHGTISFPGKSTLCK